MEHSGTSRNRLPEYPGPGGPANPMNFACAPMLPSGSVGSAITTWWIAIPPDRRRRGWAHRDRTARA